MATLTPRAPDRPSLRVLIIGAGISGLTCAITLAHNPTIRVTVVEREHVHRLIGNGIQVPPNACRVLRHLGLLDQLLEKAGGPATASVTLDHKGNELMTKDLASCESRHGAPWILVHRADYIAILLDEVRRLGVNVRYNTTASSINQGKPGECVKVGIRRDYLEESLRADVVLGCDGVNSGTRNVLRRPSPVQQPEPPLPRVYAYRVLVQSSTLLPSDQSIVNPGLCRFWLGPGAHAVFYPVRNQTLCNVVIISAVPSLNENCSKSWIRGNLGALKRELVGFLRDGKWDKRLAELVRSADQIVTFQLNEQPELPSWSSGCVGLIGDAAHAMLPCLGQGAALAAEDGYILGYMLGQLASCIPPLNNDPRDRQMRCGRIANLLKVFYAQRTERVYKVVRASREQLDINHSSDKYAENPGPWVHGGFNENLLGFDAHVAAQNAWGSVLAP